MEVVIDKQGRIVIPKEVRDKYGLSEDDRFELIAREGTIELIPFKEGDPAAHHLKEPCKTGVPEAHNKAFSRERAWAR